MEMVLCLTCWDILFEMMNSSKPEAFGYKIHMKIVKPTFSLQTDRQTHTHPNLLHIFSKQTDGTGVNCLAPITGLAHCLWCGKTQSLSSNAFLSSPH